MIEQKYIDRFWKKVSKTSNINECWEWIGGLDANGYGILKVYDKNFLAHRFSLKYIAGTNITNLFVCHKCDNPKCVNPNHLFAGSHKDNMKDRSNKNRNGSAQGIKNSQAKLLDQDILKIRSLKLTDDKIANLYGVSRQTIYLIKKRKTWKHI